MVRRRVVRRLAAGSAVLALVATQLFVAAAAVSAAGDETFKATLAGAQEAPAVPGSGSGSATVTIAADGKSIAYSVTYSGLTGAVVAAHIHAGSVGVSGPIILPLTPGPSPMSGTLNPADFKAAGGVTTFDGALAAVRAGGTYVNLHTAAHPSGEVRGQLNGPETFNATLTGAGEVPAVQGNGVGFATIVIADDAQSISYNVTYAGLTGAVVAAHIHVGDLRTAGPIILPLKVGPSPMGGTLTSADLKAAGGVTTFADAIAAIRAGNTYVNLHTAAHPGGEVRGQLVPPGNIPQIGIIADNPAGVPKGRFWAFNDYFPRSATVATGTSVSFSMFGFHTATLLPTGTTVAADMAAAGVAKDDTDDTTRNPNATTHTEFNLPGLFPAGQSQTCGTTVEPCVFDGSSVVSTGAPLAGPVDGFAVKVTANPGTYVFHCRIHPTMVGSLTVVAAGAPATTPQQAAAVSAAQVSQLVTGGKAAEASANKTSVKTNANGTRTITMQAGTSTRDGRVAVLEFLPKNVKIKKGDTVVWRPLDVNEPHTVTFPKDLNTDTVPLCEGSGGTDTPAVPGHIPPEGLTDFTCPGAASLEFEFGGGNGVSTVKSKSTVSDSGLVGYRTVAPGLAVPSTALRTTWFVRFTNAAPGRYTYVCQIHDGMAGAIIVGS